MTLLILARLRGLLPGIALAFLLQSALAAPPSFVYRGTTTPPDEVFAQGFPNHGTNEDIWEHVQGLSCYGGDTSFVPTTASEDFAVERAQYDLVYRPLPAPEYYVYRIRATGNFYSVDASLLEAARVSGEVRYRTAAFAFRHEAEWLAHRGIQANQVVSVDVYRRAAPPDDRSIARAGGRRNPNYVPAVTHASERPFGMFEAGVRQEVSMVAPSFLYTHVSACFACYPAANHTGRRERSLGPGQCPAFAIPSDSRPAAVIDPVTGNTASRHVPWKTNIHQRGGARIEAPEGCTVQAGTTDMDRLTVNCGGFRHAARFGVSIGAGGSAHQWVGARFTDGRSEVPWERSASQIAVSHTAYSLRDYGYSVNEVFSGARPDWWSHIVVAPYYPVMPAPDATPGQQVCLHRDPGFHDALLCLGTDEAHASLAAPANDATSSISAEASQRYQVCEHHDFKGNCQFLRGSVNTRSLRALGMNDAISSVRVCSKAAPREARPAPDNHGFVGDVYARDKPVPGRREYYRLLTTGAYPAFPASGASDAHWLFLRNYDECT